MAMWILIAQRRPPRYILSLYYSVTQCRRADVGPKGGGPILITAIMPKLTLVAGRSGAMMDHLFG